LGAAHLDTVEVALMPEQVAWNCTSNSTGDMACVNVTGLLAAWARS